MPFELCKECRPGKLPYPMMMWDCLLNTFSKLSTNRWLQFYPVKSCYLFVFIKWGNVSFNLGKVLTATDCVDTFGNFIYDYKITWLINRKAYPFLKHMSNCIHERSPHDIMANALWNNETWRTKNSKDTVTCTGLCGRFEILTV